LTIDYQSDITLIVTIEWPTPQPTGDIPMDPPNNRTAPKGLRGWWTVVTLSFGGNDWKTYGWTMAFLAAGAASLAFAYWELSIARSAAVEGRDQPVRIGPLGCRGHR
jgi:hypothetical protein